MKCLINGQEGVLIDYNLGSDVSWNLQFLDDDGAIVNLTAETASVEVYASSARSSVVATKGTAGSGVVLAGTDNVVLIDTETSWVDLIVGSTYTMKARLTGTNDLFSTNSFRLNVI